MAIKRIGIDPSWKS